MISPASDTAIKSATLTGNSENATAALPESTSCSSPFVPLAPLTNIASRVYLAGRLPNSPPNMERWIQQPHAIDGQTAMPETGVTDDDARDIAAYLYTLR